MTRDEFAKQHDWCATADGIEAHIREHCSFARDLDSLLAAERAAGRLEGAREALRDAELVATDCGPACSAKKYVAIPLHRQHLEIARQIQALRAAAAPEEPEKP